MSTPIMNRQIMDSNPQKLMKGKGMPLFGSSEVVIADVHSGLQKNHDDDPEREQHAEAILRVHGDEKIRTRRSRDSS